VRSSPRLDEFVRRFIDHCAECSQTYEIPP
jgi:hypothetical protein